MSPRSLFRATLLVTALVVRAGWAGEFATERLVADPVRNLPPTVALPEPVSPNTNYEVSAARRKAMKTSGNTDTLDGVAITANQGVVIQPGASVRGDVIINLDPRSQ